MAPFMTPWSVKPMAGCPKAAARSASLSTLQAPSSSEYSEWTCRCATVGVLIGEGTIGVAADAIRSVARILRVVSIYSSLGVRRVVNACGIYTDLGGSCLGGAAWAAAGEANSTWASMDELLELSGARIASLCGCEAARVVPGAAAGIALSVGACVARGDGVAMETLPLVESVVLMQRAHEYKYARCVALAGARGEYVDDLSASLAAL